MYRSRLGKDLDDITLSYVSSIKDDSDIAFYDIIGSEAHVIMLYENKLLSKIETKKILTALEELKGGNISQPDFEPEDIHELIESLVIKKTGIENGGKMHTARSRNDQVALDIRLKIRDDINILLQCLIETISTLLKTAQENTKTIMPLYTHLQQAQVGVFSHYLLSYADSLLRDLDRFMSLYGRVNQSPLGAGPVGGTSLPIDRDSTAKLLGFASLVENSIDATSTRDFVAEYVANSAIMMTNLSRLSEDFIIWSSAEFSFIELSDDFTSPSSVMPQKKNPDILELTRGKTSQVIGYLTSILTTTKGLPSGYGRDLQQIKSSIWSTSKTSITALIIIKSMLSDLTVNQERMQKATEEGFLVALDLAENLVLEKIPFRAAHNIVGNLVQLAHNSKKLLSELELSEIESLRIKDIKSTKLFELIQKTTVSSSLKQRKSKGSAGTSEQTRMIGQRTRKLVTLKKSVKTQNDNVKKSLTFLEKRVKTLTK
ncbi:argininosuccinate lyase [Candidatus Nitrosopelagicus brevis]|uniref:Argininosuccinate lyase n=1 Tax=Candidatus Nitrosopelagicus brevis TaxID=1410606 RepID=A0A0A7UZX9_9ARCH|nr:argininosuccinate lyase [Candidatus Nitrosopelagicus brevis]AJA92352.1 argininosuccinate lyase [Candidatus Nitrosopelagicus brevis]PTL88514.1 argininosuccinate lyase [Candidatus Nitrosopelagicus brevis]